MLLHITKPLTIAVAKLSIVRKMGDKHLADLNNVLQYGDVLLSRRNWEISNLLIPGKYTHAALFVGHDLVVETITSGTGEKSLPMFLFTKDQVAVMRPKFVESGDKTRIAELAQMYVGKPYDFYFDKSEEAFYCSELIWRIFKRSCKGFSKFAAKKHLGVETVVPQDLRDATKYFDLAWEA